MRGERAARTQYFPLDTENVKHWKERFLWIALTWELLTIIRVTLGPVHARLPQRGAVGEFKEGKKRERLPFGVYIEHVTVFPILQTPIMEMQWKNSENRHD